VSPEQLLISSGLKICSTARADPQGKWIAAQYQRMDGPISQLQQCDRIAFEMK
jgi:hypothetical protein